MDSDRARGLLPVMMCEHCGRFEDEAREADSSRCAPPFVVQNHSFTREHPYFTRPSPAQPDEIASTRDPAFWGDSAAAGEVEREDRAREIFALHAERNSYPLCARAIRKKDDPFYERVTLKAMLEFATPTCAKVPRGVEPFGYWIEQRHADPVLLRKPAYIPEPSALRTVTPLYATPTSAGLAPVSDEMVRDPLIHMAASLAAAISLLERGGKKAAASDKMFEQMLTDYRNALDKGRAALSSLTPPQPSAGEQSSSDPCQLAVGTRVEKPSGYPFPGEVRVAFRNKAGDLRYVVESELAPGMLHIFAPKQIAAAPHQGERA